MIVKLKNARLLARSLSGAAALAISVTISAGSAVASPPPQLSDGIASAASTELKTGDAEKAVRLFEAAIVANPSNVAAYVGLGKAQATLKRPNVATRYFDTAVKIDPNDLAALEAQSVHLIDLGDLKAAEQNIDRLKRLCVNGCTQLTSVLKAYDMGLEKSRARVLGESADG